ncbi:MAG: citramalate synthase, partial [Ruminiclostridium sp.]|nr:citramalate synthase [Ruminiclostridium sp.]
MKLKKIEIYDSTLRDGAQGEGVSFSVSDKLKIAECLDRFGVEYIEAGNPFSNPKDAEFFERAKKLKLSNAKLTAFGSTVRKDTAPEDDEGLSALLAAGTKYVTIFGKAWKLHIDCILGVTPEENLAMISSTVAYLRKKGRVVFFDAEHFFDGYRDDPAYATEVIKTAERAGASAVILCDTNGGSFPDEVSRIVKAAAKTVMVPLGIHCHNDTGCAAANTITAVKAGAVQIQGTFTGIGERCGNASLSTVIPSLQLKLGYNAVSAEKLATITKTARFISEVANLRLPGNLPYIGSSAFAHKGGMHADGVAKNTRTFEHIEPSAVGNSRSFPLSEVSGRSAVLPKLQAVEGSITKSSSETKIITEKMKELEHEGYQFEAAAASFELLVRKELGKFTPHFEIDHYRIISSMDSLDGNPYTEKANALVKVKVGDKYEITADEGEGPVNAIDKALRKALEVFYPELKKMHLIDFKVRVITSGDSTAAVTRVLIESTDGENTWTTVGASRDIINASVIALTDS